MAALQQYRSKIDLPVVFREQYILQRIQPIFTSSSKGMNKFILQTKTKFHLLQKTLPYNIEEEYL